MGASCTGMFKTQVMGGLLFAGAWELCTQSAAAQIHELQWMHAIQEEGEREGAPCSKRMLACPWHIP